MHEQGFFFQAFVYLSAAVIAVPIAKRLGLSSVLGYLAAGMVIGPFGFGLIGEEGQDVMHFAEFGVVMMLFLIGLELKPALLWRLRGPIVGTGGLQMLITTALFTSIGIVAAALPWQTALAIGLTLSLSSTALVLQGLDEKGLMKTDAGQTAFSVLLFQDIAVIPILAIMPLLALASSDDHAADAAHATTWVEGLPAWEQTLVVLAAVAAIVVGGRYLLRPVFRVIARTGLRELFTAAALLLVIGIALLMTQVGLSPALGTFVAGVVLANSEYRHELESDIDPFKGLLLAVFFIAVGASVDFGLVVAEPGRIALLVAVLLVVKFAVLFFLGRLRGLGLDQNLLFALSLAEGGEFAFVLFAFAAGAGVIAENVTASLVAVVAISMAVTPVFLLINEKLLKPRFGTREEVERAADDIHTTSPVIIAGFGAFGSVVGRLLRANGVRPVVLDYDSDRVELLRKIGLEVFYGDASRHDLLESAGAGEARLLVAALGDHDANLAVVHTVQKYFPHLTILARATDIPESHELADAGVDHIYRDNVDTSLRLGVDAMRMLGFRAYQAYRAAQKFRRHDESIIAELGDMRHDHKMYISEARERIRTLEECLLSELEHSSEERDAGWDAESLRADAEARAESEGRS